MAQFFAGYAAATSIGPAAVVAGHTTALAADDADQKATAADFNLLSVLGVAYNETRHCRALAWLLDHRRRELGTHAQGRIGMELFLPAADLPVEYAKSDYQVRREVSGGESRIDVEIACRERFLIHIEAKVNAPLGREQLEREWRDAQRQASTMNVVKHAIHMIYLTPDGTQPDHPEFRPLGWQTVARVAEEFGGLAQPPEVKLFARHYAAALRQFAAEVRADHTGPTI